MDEVYALRHTKPPLADMIFSKESLDRSGRIKTKSVHGQCQCTFFDQKTNQCQIYHDRPFECQLYPFLLRRRGKAIYLSVHKNCPHIQEKINSPEFDQYVSRLKEFLDTKETRSFFVYNQTLANDYAGYEEEIADLFIIANNKRDKKAALLNQRMTIERALLDEQSPLSSRAFANIFIWQDYFSFDVRLINDSLCVFAENEVGRFMYFPPIGENYSPQLLEECFAIMEEKNKGNGVSRIENVSYVDQKRYLAGQYQFYKKGYEYCYFKEDILALKGNGFKSKRSSYNRFIKNNPYQFRPYEKSMAKECLVLYDRWVENRKRHHDDELYLHMLDENRRVHRLALDFYERLGLIGRVVLIDGKIAAYSFGYPIRPDVFCILFEIADLDKSGLSVFIFRSFCDDPLLRPYRFINVMDDFGLKNIERTKNSFRPTILFPVYTATQLKK